MNRPTRVGEWRLFFGTPDADATEAELTRLVRRLEDAFELINFILREVSGCPAGEAEEALRIARTSIDEGLEYLQQVLSVVRDSDPSVA